jgi:hypothetical protein
MAGYLVRHRVARKSMVIGNEIKRIMLGLQLQVLAHGTKKIANMQFA